MTLGLNYRKEIRRARARVATGSKVVETRFGPIEYAEAGNAKGPPVLVIHGAGGGFDQGLDIAAGVTHDFRVIAVSRFGYLRTPLPKDASPAAQADAHAAVLDALHIPRCAVFGVSAGGPSTLQLALRHPDRVTALVLMVAAAYAPAAADGNDTETDVGTRRCHDEPDAEIGLPVLVGAAAGAASHDPNDPRHAAGATRPGRLG